MPYHFAIDPDAEFIELIIEGVLTPSVIASFQAEIRNDDLFDKSYPILIDGRGITGLADIDVQKVRLLAQNRGDMHKPGALRAFVLNEDLYFGLTRMFSSLGDTEGELAVFRNYEEARDWLAAGEACG